MIDEQRVYAATTDALEAERDAAALLLTIKAALKRRHVTDFEVWGGFRPFVEGDEATDEDTEYLINYEGINYIRGMFRCLESSAREDPSGATTNAVRIAFALGQASIAGSTDPERVERFLANAEKQGRRYKKGGTKVGGERAVDAKGRHRVLKEVWRRYRGQFGDGLRLAKKIEARQCKYVDDSGNEKIYPADLSPEGMKGWFRKWAKEEVIATEPETWATSGWYRSGSTHCRDTHDGYLAQLFETDGRWRLEIREPLEYKPPSGPVVRGHITWFGGVETRPGVSLDDAKAGSYQFIERERKRMESR
jgi:hypothetical protein